MIPETGKKYAIGYLGVFEYDGFRGIGEYTGNSEVWTDDGVDCPVFEFKIDSLLHQETAWFDEESIISEVKE